MVVAKTERGQGIASNVLRYLNNEGLNLFVLQSVIILVLKNPLFEPVWYVLIALSK
jgi:hypothetical protein